MSHLAHILFHTAHHPVAAWQGAREFRRTFTTHYDEPSLIESYDSGRELAHIVTFRRYDHS